jgi:hypothetical protein
LTVLVAEVALKVPPHEPQESFRSRLTAHVCSHDKIEEFLILWEVELGDFGKILVHDEDEVHGVCPWFRGVPDVLNRARLTRILCRTLENGFETRRILQLFVGR